MNITCTVWKSHLNTYFENIPDAALLKEPPETKLPAKEANKLLVLSRSPMLPPLVVV